LGRNEERARRRFSNYWNDNRFHFVKGDVTQPISVDTPFDYIIHAASNASPNFFKEKPVEVMKSNITGVELLLEYGLAHGLRRMVFVSTGEVYGEGNGTPFKEHDSGYVDCTNPRSCYPSSKRAAETLCASYVAEYDADIVIARPCHTYGPYFTESDNRVYAQFIRNVLSGQDIVMKSKGELFRSWVYVVDCALAILLLLVKGERGAAYNIASNESNVTIRQLAELTAGVAGRKVVMELAESGVTPPVTKAVFSTERLEALGWKPLTSLQTGITHTLKTMEGA
jgi:nucleoside-diphosphate-sugar epimerase